MPLTNPEGYDYSFNGDRNWQKNREKTVSEFCDGVNLDRNFDFFFENEDISPCDDNYPGSSSLDSAETRAISDYFDEYIQGQYRQSTHISINGNGKIIKNPWKGTMGHDKEYKNVRNQFYYWNYVQSSLIGNSLINDNVEFKYDSNSDPENDHFGKALDFFGQKEMVFSPIFIRNPNL